MGTGALGTRREPRPPLWGAGFGWGWPVRLREAAAWPFPFPVTVDDTGARRFPDRQTG